MKRMKKELYSDGGGNAMTNTRISPPDCSADGNFLRLDQCTPARYALPVDRVPPEHLKSRERWTLRAIRFSDQLPPLDAVYDDIFRRKPDDRMKRDPRRRNMLYHAFYQYFVLQFFGEDFNSTVRIHVVGYALAAHTHVTRCTDTPLATFIVLILCSLRTIDKSRITRLQVTGSQLYGTDDISRAELRSFAGGKLRTERRLNDQHYPPRLSLAKKLITAISRWKTGGPTRWVSVVAVILSSRRACGDLL